MGKMKDSSLLKWAHNNNRNSNKGKSKEDNKNWIHPAASLTSGHIAYLVKYLGCTEVDKPKGIEVVKEGIRKLKFSQQIKKAEGTKTPKVELTVSVDGVAIQDPKSKKIQNQYPLHRISYCADDKAEKRFFSFIAKEEDEDKHTCFVFVSDKLAEEITLTIGQAFDLAYKRYMSGSQGKEETGATSLEDENRILKSRLKEVSGLLTATQLNNFLDKHHITDVCEMKGEMDNQSTNSNIKAMSIDTSQASVDPTCDDVDQLINLDQPVDKFDQMTLDDLNDDDFDPRAADRTGDSSDSSDDFNPRRSFPTPSFQSPAAPAPTFQSPAAPAPTFQSPAAPAPTFQSPAAPAPTFQSPAAVFLTPPAIPPREPAKVAAATNPFSAPFMGAGAGTPQDPFGMSTFNTPEKIGGSSPFGITDVFADLDPLKK